MLVNTLTNVNQWTLL